MKKNSGGGDCDPRPKASENETTVGWSQYIALHIKKAKNRFRVLQDLKFRRRHSTYRVSNMEMVDCRGELLLHIDALFLVSFTFPPSFSCWKHTYAQYTHFDFQNNFSPLFQRIPPPPNYDLCPGFSYKFEKCTNQSQGYPSVEVSKNIVGPKRLLVGFSTTK